MAKIDPWSSQAIENYEHVFKEFGLKEFSNEMKKKLNHRFFKRNIVIAHRDYEKILKRIEQKKPFINITGIASSGKLHLGHLVDIELFLFHKQMGGKNFFTIADIDAYVSRPDDKMPSMEKAKEMAINNAAHVLALGLDEKDLYVQSNYEKKYYEFAFELGKKITKNMFEAVYGHVALGKVSASLLQYADILHPQLKEFEGKMPSVTGIGLDQDPHARITRDVARKISYEIELPSFIYFKHQSGLKAGTKMSASDPYSAIFLNDSADEIKKKINKAFTGGKNTAEEQRKHGANPDICKVCEILTFHHPDNGFVKSTLENEKKGKTLCGDVKKLTIEFLQEMLAKHQEKVEKKKTLAQKIVLG